MNVITLNSEDIPQGKYISGINTNEGVPIVCYNDEPLSQETILLNEIKTLKSELERTTDT